METTLQKTISPNKTTAYALFFLGTLLFSYTASRAYLMDITWDEASTYLDFIRNGIFYLDHYDEMSANNHLLTNLLGFGFVKLFGISEFVLRLSSLLSHILFLVFSAKLVLSFNKKWLSIACFLIININPYLLDFFSLGRGYGLSMGLMMASIYYLFAFHKDFNQKFAVVSILFGAFSVLASYVLLNFFLILFGVIVLLTIYNPSAGSFKTFSIRITLKKLRFSILLFFLLLCIVLPVAFFLRKAGALFYGGGTSFWKDTFFSIVDRSFYELPYNYWFQRILKAFIILTLIGGVVFSIAQLLRKQVSPSKLFLSSLLLILGLCILSSIIQHYILGTLFLIERTAVFLIVLFTLCFSFFINELSAINNRLAFIAYIFAIFSIIHFANAFNLTYVLEWKKDADTKQMLLELEKIKTIPSEKNNVSMDITMHVEPGVNFYRSLNDLTWLNTVVRIDSVSRGKKTHKLFDYFYLTPREFANLNPDSIEIIKTFPLTHNILGKPRNKFKNSTISINEVKDYSTLPSGNFIIDKTIEFSELFTYKISDSSASNRNAVALFQAQVKASSLNNDNLKVVISFQQGDNAYRWRHKNIKDDIKNVDEWTDIYFSAEIPFDAKVGDELKIYIWNPAHEELAIKKMQFKWIDYR